MSITSSRHIEIDFLRGFAVLGIFQINIIFFAQPHQLYNFPTVYGNHDLWNSMSWLYTNLFVEGSMFGLFSMLFGASAMIILDSKKLMSEQGVGTVDRYYRRMLWLLVFGLVHAYVLVSPMEILYTYAVLGLLLFPLRNLQPATLLICGSILVILGATDFSLITDANAEAVSSSAISPDSHGGKSYYNEIVAALSLYRSSYAAIFSANVELAYSWQSSNFFEDQLFDSGGMMLIGMAFYKLGILTGLRSLRFYLLMAIGGYLLAFMLRWPNAITFYQSNFDPQVFFNLPTAPTLSGRLFLTAGHLGMLISLYKLNWLRPVFMALAASGRMALTHYISQTLFAILLFYGFGAGLFGSVERYQLLLIALGFGVAQIRISLSWLRHFQYGPLEWLWRCLVQLKLQPIKRAPQLDGVFNTDIAVTSENSNLSVP